VIDGDGGGVFCQGLNGLSGTVAHWQNRPITGLGKLTIWPLRHPGIGRIFVRPGPAWSNVTIIDFYAVNSSCSTTMRGLTARVGAKPGSRGRGGAQRFAYRVGAIVAVRLVGLAGANLRRQSQALGSP